MMCKQCGSVTFVIDSRRGPVDENTTRRRRKCPGCGYRFSTYEIERSAYDDTVRLEERVAKLRDVAVAALQQIADTVPAPEPRSDECV